MTRHICVVTTGHERDGTLASRALELAGFLTLNGQPSLFVEREGQSLTKMMNFYSADAALIVSPAGTSLRLKSGALMRLHGGIGVLRIRKLLKGGRDNMVDACELQPGDHFVDATAGQLQDAMVASAVVGPTGRVIAFEASPLLYAVSSGRPVCTGDADVDAALQRVEVQLGEHTALLAAMPTDSVDVVFFDPMFRRPAKSSLSFHNVLRGLAHSGSLSHEALIQARRVARRCVVVTDQPLAGSRTSSKGGAMPTNEICLDTSALLKLGTGDADPTETPRTEDTIGELERLGIPVFIAGQVKRFGVLRC